MCMFLGHVICVNWWASISWKKNLLSAVFPNAFHLSLSCISQEWMEDIYLGHCLIFDRFSMFWSFQSFMMVYSDSSWLDSAYFVLLRGRFWYIFHNALFSLTFCVNSLYVRWKIPTRQWLYPADLSCVFWKFHFIASMKLQEIRGIRHCIQQLVLTPNFVSEWSDTPACCKSLWSPECCITAAG